MALAGIALLALLIGVTWPRPMGLVVAVAGLTGPPVNPPLPDKPSIVVLPFINLSDDPEQEHFADAITVGGASVTSFLSVTC